MELRSLVCEARRCMELVLGVWLHTATKKHCQTSSPAQEPRALDSWKLGSLFSSGSIEDIQQPL